MISIKAYIENIAPFNAEDWALFSSKLKPYQLPKKAYLQKKGDRADHLYFIKSGIVRLYIPKLENDLTFGFVFENEFVTAFDAFLTRTPSQYHIQALTDLDTWQMSYDDLQMVYNNTNLGHEVGRHMAEKMFLIKSKRELSLLNKTAEERYLDLFEERPRLIQAIPLKHIASYIGVTPQALSRIRKRSIKKAQKQSIHN